MGWQDILLVHEGRFDSSQSAWSRAAPGAEIHSKQLDLTPVSKLNMAS